MYIARTLNELYAAVNRDEHEIKMMGSAMEEYKKFGDRRLSAAAIGGMGGAGAATIGFFLGGPIGAGIGAATGLALGTYSNQGQKKDEDKYFAKNSCNGLRQKIEKYYRVSSKGNSYITITHK